jgi:VanZ family protein
MPMKTEKRSKFFDSLLIFWLPVVVWSVVIFSFSSRMLPGPPGFYWLNFVEKKTAHLIEYAILSILYFRAFIFSGIKRKKAAILAIIVCFLYGLTDEFHQSFIPGREPTLRDVIIDTLGAGLGIFSVWKLLPKAPKKLKILAQKLQIN